MHRNSCDRVTRFPHLKQSIAVSLGRPTKSHATKGVLVLATIGVCALRADAQSPLNLVLDTGDNTALPSRITSNGAPIVRVGPANPTATINGVTIRYLGTDSVEPIVTNPFAAGSTSVGTAARYFVSGDLNLAAGQRIYGVGPNLIKLEVGSNATIASGATIDVSAERTLPGAGGGAGGSTTPVGTSGYSMTTIFATFNSRVINSRGGDGGDSNHPTGFPGRQPIGAYYVNDSYGSDFVEPLTERYVSLFRASKGGDGLAGQGNVGPSAGGAERLYRSPVFQPFDPGIADFVLADQGKPGLGGPAGSSVAGVGGKGGTGGSGTAGGNGANGLEGSDATLSSIVLNPSAIYLRGGNGGGAGGGGGTGIAGGWGGAGGGGGASGQNNTGGRDTGNSGGDGGTPGAPGVGGTGGNGGAGGGGIQLLVRGKLTMSGAMSARGADGTAGAAGGIGAAGGAGQLGGTTNILDIRGNGGNGAAGGRGGNGGKGGDGLGGSGGVVQIVASSLAYTGSTDVLGGANGNGISRAANGATYFHAYSGPSASLSTSAYFGALAAGANPYRSYTGLTPITGGPVGLTPNVPTIEGGAAPYGMLVGPNINLVAPAIASFAGNNAPAPKPGHARVGAVARVNASFLANQFGMPGLTNDNQDMLIFSAIGGTLQKPAMMAVDPAHEGLLGVVPSGPVPLRAGNGYLNDPTLTPGAVAPTDMPTLPAASNFVMYASGTLRVTAAFSPYGFPRYFTNTPQVGVLGSPGASAVFLEDRGMAFVGFNAKSNTDNSRAGYEQEIQESGEYADPNVSTTVNLRAGDTGTVSASVYGSGNSGTLVYGDVRIRTRKPQPASAEPGPLFTQIATSYSQIPVYQSWETNSAQIVSTGLAVGTTNRVGEVIFNPDYDDTTRTIVFPVSGRIFGPTPRLGGSGVTGNTFTFDTIDPSATASASFDLQNADVLSSIGPVWRNAIRNSPQLISLTVLGYELIDPSGVFTVSNIGRAPFTLNGDQLRAINVGFDPTGVGTYSATLRLLTDLNAPAGQPGDYFTINLSAAAVPEPTSLIVLGGVGIAMLRRPGGR
jgi:hypothetical protein